VRCFIRPSRSWDDRREQAQKLQRRSPPAKRFRSVSGKVVVEGPVSSLTPINGVVCVVTGGGKRIRPVGKSSFTAFSDAVIHFVYVDITGDTLALHAIDGVGAEFDSLVLRRGS
jgi:hypothetical protein